MIAISTSCGIVWAVGRKGELYYREGISVDNPSGSNWNLIEAPKNNIGFAHKTNVSAKSVSLTKGAAWVVLTNGVTVVRTDVTKTHQDGKQWKHLTGI